MSDPSRDNGSPSNRFSFSVQSNLSRVPIPVVYGTVGRMYYEDVKHLLTGRPLGLPYNCPWLKRPGQQQPPALPE